MLTDKLRIKVIGAGGIGCCLLPTLLQVLNYGTSEHSFYYPQLTIIDGDEWEPHNKQRQMNCWDTHSTKKANILVSEYEEKFKGVSIYSIPEYIDENNVIRRVRENDIVFICVDNHATRRIVSQRCRELNNVIAISGGNELTDGNIQVYVRKDGKDVTQPIDSDFHPEIKFAGKFVKTSGGCQQETVSQPQLLITNLAIASMMLNAFYALLIDKLEYDEVYKDIISNKTRPVKR